MRDWNEPYDKNIIIFFLFKDIHELLKKKKLMATRMNS